MFLIAYVDILASQEFYMDCFLGHMTVFSIVNSCLAFFHLLTMLILPLACSVPTDLANAYPHFFLISNIPSCHLLTPFSFCRNLSSAAKSPIFNVDWLFSRPSSSCHGIFLFMFFCVRPFVSWIPCLCLYWLCPYLAKVYAPDAFWESIYRR